MKKLLALILAAAVLSTCALALTPAELDTILEENYAGVIPAAVKQAATVADKLSALGDPYAHYYTAQEYSDFLSDLEERSDQGATAEVKLERGRVGWITLKNFGGNTYAELKSGVEAIETSADKWIVDLRGNGGGELKAAVDAMSVFAGGGALVYLRDAAGQLYTGSSQYDKLTMEPAIVLVDSRTASAAELYAATLRDRQMGLIIGSRTYGKGVAQTAFTKDHPQYGAAFADGSALLLSTDQVFSDRMVSNDVTGVIPHLMVEPGQAEAVARLLCAAAPAGNTSGYLRLSLARWRWYVKLGENNAALQALLEALPPQSKLYLGTGGADGWSQTTAAAVAQSQGLTGYTPRAFSDVSGSSYADAINALKTYGILKGDERGNFNPDSPLNRASLCALLAQAMGYAPSKAAPAFADTPADAWYTPYITTLNAMGIINGYDDGLFHPDDPIPHQQFMAILARITANTNQISRAAMEAGPTQEELDSGNYDAYDPWARTGAWLLDGAWHAAAKDIDPHAVTLREEAAFDLWSMLNMQGLLLN